MAVQPLQATAEAAAGPPPQVEQLKEILLEEAEKVERLRVELHARDRERWQLLQLLKEKDEQLTSQALAVPRQRAALAASRKASRRWCVLCAFRCWREELRQHASCRRLREAKQRLVVAKISHACSTLRATLHRIVGKLLGGSLHALWFHAASQQLSLVDNASVEDLEAIHGTKPGVEELVVIGGRPGTPPRRRYFGRPRYELAEEPPRGHHELSPVRPATIEHSTASGLILCSSSACSTLRVSEASASTRAPSTRSSLADSGGCASSSSSLVPQQMVSSTLDLAWAAAKLALCLDAAYRRRLLFGFVAMISSRHRAHARQAASQVSLLQEHLQYLRWSEARLEAREAAAISRGNSEMSAMEAKVAELKVSAAESALTAAAAAEATALVEASRRAEKLEVEAQARGFREGRLHEQATIWDAAHAEARAAARCDLAGEAAACGAMAAELRSRLAEVVQAERDLGSRPRTLWEGSSPAPSLVPSGLVTPRLCELDAYAELVEKLKIELLREREEREAAVRSLASLRGSYRLLLQRVGSSAAILSPAFVQHAGR